MSEKTCAERVGAHRQGREDHLEGLYRIANASGTEADYAEHDIDSDLPGWDAEDRAHEAISELPLAIEIVKTIKVTFSTGGPADGLTITLDADDEVSDVRYWFADWFDHAEEVVAVDSPLHAYAEQLADLMVSS